MTEAKEPTARELAALARVKAGTLKRLRFTVSYGVYNAGQIAGFTPVDAEAYLRRRVAFDIDATPHAQAATPAEIAAAAAGEESRARASWEKLPNATPPPPPRPTVEQLVKSGCPEADALATIAMLDAVAAGKTFEDARAAGESAYDAAEKRLAKAEEMAEVLEPTAPAPAAEPKPAEEPAKTETTAAETPPAPAAEAAPAPAAEPKPAEEPRRGKNRGR